MPLALFAVAAVVAATPARPVTYADSGKTIHMQRGAHRALRLGAQRTWNQPRVGRRAVRLTPVFYFRYPGFQEWTITATKRGTTTITAVGRRPTVSIRRFRLTVVVR